MRKIKFKLLTQQQIEVVETNVRTFGELRDLIISTPKLAEKIKFEAVDVEVDGIKFKETIKFIERESRTEYGKIEEALLPAGDCLFFVTPTRTKSGTDISTIKIYTSDEISNMNYKEIRTYISKLNKEYLSKIDLTGTRLEIIELYNKWVNKEDEFFQQFELNYEEILSKAIVLIEQAIQLGKLNNNKYAINGITFDDLEVEALKLKNELNN